IALAVDESALTGESLPVSKSPRPTATDVGVAERASMVLSGTVVTAGRGEAVVVATGHDTEVGRIAGLLSEDEPETPLQRDLARIGRRVALLAGVAAVVVFVVGLGSGGSIESLFLIAVALAVAAIPEGLPAVTTITLARGVRTMATRNAIVRRLPAVEALGAAEVICTDKTGTLTRNRMSVVETAVETERLEHRLARVVASCSDVRWTDGEWTGDPTEIALVEWAEGSGYEVSEIRGALPRVDELGFDSDRKRMVTLHQLPNGGWLVAMKGAPEVIASLASKVETVAGPRPMDESYRERVLAKATDLARRGLRTIAVAELESSTRPEGLEQAEGGVTWLGLFGMADEARPEVEGSIQVCEDAGIRVVMITGDHVVTATSIADQIGLRDGRQVVDHRGLSEMDDAQLAARIADIGVFARVEPRDKVRIVQAWQQRGDLVAMTGDGVNDAPALRMADIGVAMGSGTEVSKDASDVVLADDDFSTIVAAVELGRAIFANLRKVTYFLLAANLSEIVVMLLAFLLFASYGEPLLAVQLLWVNLVTDGLPALALGVDPPAREQMQRPPDSDRNMLSVAHQARLLWQGVALAIGPLGLFWYGVTAGYSWEETRSMAFTGLVMTQLVHSLSVRAQSRSVFRTPVRNNALLLAIGVSAMVHVGVVSTAAGQTFLDVVPLHPEAWLLIGLGAVVSALLIDLVKVVVRNARPRSVTALDTLPGL
ncbi:MAG: cation-transporting P-type ATPase, partial [Acidimicrobiia bacterium]|nr:cation-transporting P-type ATPase [Acidimicrobiia bacterium]